MCCYCLLHSCTVSSTLPLVFWSGKQSHSKLLVSGSSSPADRLKLLKLMSAVYMIRQCASGWSGQQSSSVETFIVLKQERHFYFLSPSVIMASNSKSEIFSDPNVNIALVRFVILIFYFFMCTCIYILQLNFSYE